MSESIFVGAGTNLSNVNLKGVYLNDMNLAGANLTTITTLPNPRYVTLQLG